MDGQGSPGWGNPVLLSKNSRPDNNKQPARTKEVQLEQKKGVRVVKTIGNVEGDKVEGRGRRTSADCPLCGQLPALIPSIVCPNFVIS